MLVVGYPAIGWIHSSVLTLQGNEVLLDEVKLNTIQSDESKEISASETKQEVNDEPVGFFSKIKNFILNIFR